MADESFGVEIVEDIYGGIVGYEFKDSFEGPSPVDVPESPSKYGVARPDTGDDIGCHRGGKNHPKGLFVRGGQQDNNDGSFNGPDSAFRVDGLKEDENLSDTDDISDLPYQASGATQGGYLSLQDTASQDESFNTSTRRLGERNDVINPKPRRKREGTGAAASPWNMLMPSPVDEDQRHGRRRTIRIVIIFLLVLGLLWFMVYWFSSGRQKASLRRSASFGSMAPSDSSAPSSKSPSDSLSAPPVPATISPTTSSTDRPTANPTSSPTASPSDSPSVPPVPATDGPTANPTGSPTASPSDSPSVPPVPATDGPTENPTGSPTASPSDSPSVNPFPATDSPTMSPVDGPTGPPTMSPSNFPSAPPVPATDSPTISPAPTSVDDVTDPLTVLAMAERDIRSLIDDDPLMGPKFVRLGFHDCVGFCDGCVDMTFGDNFGLEVPIDALAPIVERYERQDLGFSRADIWALSALVATDIAQERSETKVDFRMMFIGRKNCEVRSFNRCFAEDGVTARDCSPKLGPFHHLPLADITTADLFHFFNNEFGFTDKETVAIMGAHTLGALHKDFSGIDGENGWVRDNLLLDNDYYHEIVGGESIDDDIDVLVDDAPPWLRVMEENSEESGFPNKPVWEAFPRSLEDPDRLTRLVMLNADVAIVRELNSTNLRSDGRVTCVFIDSVGGLAPRCPHAERSLMLAAEYKFDNDLWLNDFRNVYHKMLNHGCSDSFCDTTDGDVCVCTL